MKVVITIEVDGNDVKVSTETEKEPDKVDRIADGVSIYAKHFDESCTGWCKDVEYSLMFLKTQQNYANEMLRSKGYLFLNDVYAMLGIPKTKEGQIVGWIYDEDHPNGDNFVDFGLNDSRNAKFINGYEKVALLDFNVDGNILDLI